MKIKSKSALAEKAAEFVGSLLLSVVVGFLLFSVLGCFEESIATLRW